jgi:hypothetical protein
MVAALHLIRDGAAHRQGREFSFCPSMVSPAIDVHTHQLHQLLRHRSQESCFPEITIGKHMGSSDEPVVLD